MLDILLVLLIFHYFVISSASHVFVVSEFIKKNQNHIESFKTESFIHFHLYYSFSQRFHGNGAETKGRERLSPGPLHSDRREASSGHHMGPALICTQATFSETQPGN